MNDMIKQMVQYVDVDQLKDKGLYGDNDYNERFYILYRKYKILLEKYLLKKLSLREMDAKIVNSGLLFMPVKSDDMDIYQLLSTLNLKYIYLRNNLNVDKLSMDDINKIVNLNDAELNNPDEKLIDLIHNTYKNVLDANRKKEDICYMICYGTDSDYFWHDSRELVFGIRQDEYADNGLGQDNEWLDNYFKQMQFLGNMINELEPIFSTILDIKVKFLLYDNISIEKSMSR